MEALQQNKSTPIIRLSDFQSIEHCLLLGNTTSRTEIRDSSQLKIIEFLEKGMILRAPKFTCAQGHSLMLYIFFGRKAMKREQLPAPAKAEDLKFFLITAKVTGSEETEKNMVHLTLEFVQFNPAEWSKFLGQFQSKQNQINNIVKNIRG